MRRLAVVLALIAAPALAEAPMSGDAFEAYTTGKTLLYVHTLSSAPLDPQVRRAPVLPKNVRRLLLR